MSEKIDTIEYGSATVESVVTNSKKGKKTILHPMLVEFPEGQVTAIMGPSGSGKTTLLDFLTGSISGGAIANGEVDLAGSKSYVPQGDRLHGFYTCNDYMKHYARLAGMELNDDTNQYIDEIFEVLGLTAHRDTIVGDIFLRGLSGGQKRRLSVALEALTSPCNLFLDEPTSGLDSESALRLIKFAKEYARQGSGRRVILTIHQPSSFIWKELDNIVLLSQGKLMYQGSRTLMEQFFELNGYPTPPEYNPADHYVAMVNVDFSLSTTEEGNNMDPNAWEQAFKDWQTKEEKNLNEERRNSRLKLLESNTSTRGSFSHRNDSAVAKEDTVRGNTCTAIIELSRRYFKNLIFNPGILGTRLAMYIMLSLIIGALFFDLSSLTTYTSVQSRIALLFYCVAFFYFHVGCRVTVHCNGARNCR